VADQYLLEKFCQDWAFPAVISKGKRVYGQVPYNWVAVLLLYMRNFPSSIPATRSFYQQRRNEDTFPLWVKLFTMQTLPKFRRRIFNQKAKEQPADPNKQNAPAMKKQVINSDTLRNAPVFSMLEHPRFCIDWLSWLHSKDPAAELSTDSQGKTSAIISRKRDRTEFRSYVAEALQESTLAGVSKNVGQDASKSHHAAMSATGAINGDKAPEEDPFLEFPVEMINRDEHRLIGKLHVAVSRKWMTSHNLHLYGQAFKSAIAFQFPGHPSKNTHINRSPLSNLLFLVPSHLIIPFGMDWLIESAEQRETHLLPFLIMLLNGCSLDANKNDFVDQTILHVWTKSS